MTGSKRGSSGRIEAFDLDHGRVLAGKYEVMTRLGAGWEGEVYLVRETATGIVRAAKAFFPQRNVGDRTARFYARKLHKLRNCPIVIQYHGRETFVHRRLPITFLVSEYVEGELLSDFLDRQPQKRLSAFAAVHLLHALACGIEEIHRMREYHGDLHVGNIMVRRFGLGFDLKLLDQAQRFGTRYIREDVVDMVRILYDALGGRRRYASQPPEVKAICCGLKRSLILAKFRTAGQLRRYLEGLAWQ